MHFQYEQFYVEHQLASLVTPGQDKSSSIVMLLHGWLDNARSFDVLAAAAQRQGHHSHWLAVDMPGHGRSPWAKSTNDYMAWGYIAPIARLIKSLGQPIDLICHSMGTNTGIMLAASGLLAIRSITLLDGIGPLTDGENTAARQLRKSLSETLNGHSSGPNRQQSINRFATVADAVQRRQQFSQYLSFDELTNLVRRNLIKSGGGYGWGTDPRLRRHSVVRLNEAHLRSFCRAIDIPVLVLQAQKSLIPDSLFEQRLDYFKRVQHHVLPGHHHFHMAEQTYGEVLKCINNFHHQLDN